MADNGARATLTMVSYLRPAWEIAVARSRINATGVQPVREQYFTAAGWSTISRSLGRVFLCSAETTILSAGMLVSLLVSILFRGSHVVVATVSGTG